MPPFHQQIEEDDLARTTKSKDREIKIQAALKDLHDKAGRLTANAVVRAARQPKHILHREFIWDDRRAAGQQRLDRARELISRFVTITVVHRSHKVVAPYYVRDPALPPDQQGYVALTTAALNLASAQTIMRTELDRCASVIERARSVVCVLDTKHPGMSVALESLLAEIIDLRDRIAA
jgi:hypothetical protein